MPSPPAWAVVSVPALHLVSEQLLTLPVQDQESHLPRELLVPSLHLQAGPHMMVCQHYIKAAFFSR